MVVKADARKNTPVAELRSYMARFGPKDQKLMKSVRAAVRKRFPTANELAYDYTSFFVISYSPTERGIDGIVAIAGRPDGVRLYLMEGPRLPDPKKLLLGTGKQARYLRVESVSDLAQADVKALIAAAIDKSKTPLPAKGKGRLIMMSDAAKKKARRKPKK
ncbi:MAG: DUF1801 domain-containing protein [Pseudomonadota bacterium]